MGCDVHIYVEYKCGNGMPWQADEHHFAAWNGRCKDDKDVPESEWCDHCVNDGNEQKYCDAGYLDYSEVRASVRDYQLFGALANVRGSGPDPKGLPEDVSPTIQAAADMWGADGHSHSYLSLEDFKVVIKEHTSYPESQSSDAFYDHKYQTYKDYPPDYTTLINYCDKLREEKSVDKHILGYDISSEVQIRLVFWFDN